MANQRCSLYLPLTSRLPPVYLPSIGVGQFLDPHFWTPFLDPVLDPIFGAKGRPGSSKTKQILCTVVNFYDFATFSSNHFWTSFWTPFWTPFWERFGPQDRRIRPWKPPLSRPTGLRSSKRPPRGLQGLPGTPSGPPGTSLRDPRTSKRTPRTPPRDRPEASQEPLVPHPQEPLAQHSQARRNARERLNLT